MVAASRRQSLLIAFADQAKIEGPVSVEFSSWESEVQRFLTWKRSESSVGENWIRRMRWELNRVPALLRKVGATSIALTPIEFGPQHVRSLRTGIGWERNTFLLHFSALRQFLRWTGNPVADQHQVWNLPSGDSSRRRWLPKERLAELFRSASPRARLLIALEGFNGLRRIEVLRLRVRDVDFSEGLLNVRGKGHTGGKWRRIPVSELARSELERAIAGRDPEQPVLPLSASGADLLLQSAAAAARFSQKGIRVSHHDLRRTFGRIAYEAGVGLVELKNLLGHASVEMSVRYIRLDSDRLRQGLQQFSEYLKKSQMGDSRDLTAPPP